MPKSSLLSLSRNTKKTIFVIHDIVMIILSFWVSIALCLDGLVEVQRFNLWLLLFITIPITIIAFARFGLYRAVLRYFGSQILTTCLIGSLISVFILALSAFFLQMELPKSVSVMFFLLLLVLLVGSRFFLRGWLRSAGRHSAIPVVIYGAGESGRQLLEAIKQVNEYNPVAFVDDYSELQNAIVQNLKVYSPTKLSDLIEEHRVEKILLAIPSASTEQRRQIMQRLQSYTCEVLTIPGMKDLVDGKVTLSSLKKVSVMDLLGRSPVEPIPELISANIQDKVVMVTGAGGSIGSELCRQIIVNQPKQLILFELSEFSLYQIDKELNELIQAQGLDIAITPLLGSVQQQNRLLNVMQAFGVQTVYHAAAYKHVPLVEFNTIEGVRNNIFGTLYCAQAAIDAAVDTFVLISTDKAVRPTNTMGASKRMAELVLQALAQEQQTTHFCMVRFGNVLGSSGSVIPLFEKQIADGGPITLTHPEITRYFMTIPEAAQLVIQAGAMGHGGDVFVLDMGESVKILDLARQMIRLSGLAVKDERNPDGDIEIKITGLRPGEKLYEELLIGAEAAGTQHPRIMTADEQFISWADLSELLEKIQAACKENDQYAIRQYLLQAPTEFNPKDDICDLLWAQNAWRRSLQ